MLPPWTEARVASDPHAKQCKKYALLRAAGKVTTWTFHGDPTLPPLEWP